MRQYGMYLICVSNDTKKQIGKSEINETKEQRVKEETQYEYILSLTSHWC